VVRLERSAVAALLLSGSVLELKWAATMALALLRP
jgi:hypothetical protein